MTKRDSYTTFSTDNKNVSTFGRPTAADSLRRIQFGLRLNF
jgi:hypothetical protein